MSSMEDDLSGRRPQWKMSSMEDDLYARQPQWKTTSMEEDLDGLEVVPQFVRFYFGLPGCFAVILNFLEKYHISYINLES